MVSESRRGSGGPGEWLYEWYAQPGMTEGKLLYAQPRWPYSILLAARRMHGGMEYRAHQRDLLREV